MELWSQQTHSPYTHSRLHPESASSRSEFSSFKNRTNSCHKCEYSHNMLTRLCKKYKLFKHSNIIKLLLELSMKLILKSQLEA